ncbi:hypothetical protein X777_12808 [Ooceraea biroi]|uniref:CHK kinase-like domain-containing protein n=1 Tax=Ooceraea biroi TaxID=2015173 RepID=A0A026X031_OOCBI|nr:hypothetical protein X777_12808 [Ooceraea biroi]
MTTLNDISLSEKIKRQLTKVERLETEIASTIIHGQFTRSKIFFKRDDEGCHTKLIDFETIKYDSLSIDFGRIFLTNLPNEDNVSKLQNLFWSMISIYVKKLQQVYSQVPSTLIQCDIVYNMILSYIN